MTTQTNANLNGDLTATALMQSNEMDWQASPSPGVWRKRLEHVGPAESGRVTSIVRYDPGSRFAAHRHPDGEEILVLDGVFEDEHGRYPAGTHVLNPDGSTHAPFTDEGCTLFVKLRQYAGAGRRQQVVDSSSLDWQPGAGPGRWVKALYRQDGFPEQIRLVRFDAGARVPHHVHRGGEEVFVIEGRLQDENGTYGPGTWLRLPDGSAHTPYSDEGCLLFVREGGL